MLAGLAVGMGVTEGADIGAMFSLLVAAFVVYQAGLHRLRPDAASAWAGSCWSLFAPRFSPWNPFPNW